MAGVDGAIRFDSTLDDFFLGKFQAFSVYAHIICLVLKTIKVDVLFRCGFVLCWGGFCVVSLTFGF